MEINIKNPNALEMKSENQRTLLNILRRRSTSRADLAEQLRLTRSCITFLVDDLMATGGTVLAAAKLVEQLGAEVAAMLFLIELKGLDGWKKVTDYNVKTIVTYEGK